MRYSTYVAASATASATIGEITRTAPTSPPKITTGVRVGDAAEVRLDAYPNRVVAGVVEQLQASADGSFTIYPSTDLDPTNVQKIDQYIAVRVRPAATDDVRLYPGLNARVTILVGR
jgi:membrane fusion protein (multidrug efflux system)